ncbi:lysylphosphatidylglycerol synthase transmembrane domain-containing protein [Phormidium sp. CCY1219]|uniref:lysylphosphatidylglycerol synthase transmembrane domain-containing protein n=1 Tax=Phormidium sp. CCY1219 TaxID=2886104 RepID=UPI002D1F0002|nr:lysylphosphatidylglycerol synthase domain-containing protein [Phormidium sp. CCY1219]MEB3827730.1 lysylphosphatidylglycerol synthase domain-containing protein [Phormidium sp. CCY1219]
MKPILSRLKPYLRWFILGATLFFLAQTLKDNAAAVANIEITQSSWIALAIALGITMLAHLWSGWVWLWILAEFNQPVPLGWGLQVYLTTNIAKYLPGNVWHFYGRITAVAGRGVSLPVATLSVLLEPLLMAASAFIIALLGSGNLLQNAPTGGSAGTATAIFQFLGLGAVLIGIHPKILNPIVQFLGQKKLKKSQKAPGSDAPAETPNPESTPPAAQLARYPALPFLGEFGFLLFRGVGFMFAVQAMTPVQVTQLPMLLGAFSFAWLLGLVVPGAPGGIGVFEATAIALLKGNFSAAVILGAVAFYRLISVLAEASAAAIAWLCGKLNPPTG